MTKLNLYQFSLDYPVHGQGLGGGSRAMGGLHLYQVISHSTGYTWRQISKLTFTASANLESPVKITCIG